MSFLRVRVRVRVRVRGRARARSWLSCAGISQSWSHCALPQVYLQFDKLSLHLSNSLDGGKTRLPLSSSTRIFIRARSYLPPVSRR